MMKRAVTIPAFRSLCYVFTLAFWSVSNFAFAQPNPQMTGDTVVCLGATHFYATQFQQGNSWTWSVSPGGQITQNNGNFIAVKWNGPANSSQFVSVTETEPGGASATVQKTVLIKSNALSCHNLVNVSIEQSGVSVINPDMLLEGNYNTYQGFTVVISTQAGAILGNSISCAYVGQTLVGKVIENCNNNSCWTYLKIEDKKAPLFMCPTGPVEISCETNVGNYPAPPVADNCDPNPLVSLTGNVINNSNVCNGVTITRTWIATDKYNNSSTCIQELFISPNATIDFPKDRIWECSDYQTFPNITNPTPYTGVLATTGSGIATGTNGVYCQYTSHFKDDTLAACGNTIKIIRTWTVMNWCTGQVILTDNEGDDNEQVIKIMDTQKPVVTVPAINLNANNPGSLAILCTSTGLLPAPVVTDECNSFSVKIFTPVGEAIYVNGSDGKQGGHVPSPGLKIGIHTILYKVTDACGNITEIHAPAIVADKTAPTVICDEYTNVNLDAFGVGEAFAQTFDDGSHDNCCIGQMLVKRFGEPDSHFAPAISFFCSDDSVMVVLRVFDCFDNYGDCMVTAIVRDKVSPSCIPPPQKTIPCTAITGDIDQAFLNTFGNAVTFDNCSSQIVELPHQESINSCGEGFIIRKFSAVDASGNISGTCEQHIYVTGASDWAIHFPANWTGSCGQMPDAPNIKVDNIGCDQFAVSVKDQFFGLSLADSACYKIVRTYKVINWCYYDPYVDPIKIPTNPDGLWIDEKTYGNFGHYEYQQIIKVHDDVPPKLSYTDSGIYCSLDSNCAEGFAHVPINIDGECSPNFDIVYHLDINSDNTFDLSGTGFFSGILPLGKHKIRYIVEDGCSNEATIVVSFSVVDCKKPTPVCSNGLIVDIMQTGMIEICAKQFNDGSFDNCPGPLTYTFSADPGDSCRTFLCNQTYLEIPIEIWVTDAAGNKDYCTTFVFIQDNFFACDSNLPVQGLISTEDNKGVEGVAVSLNGSGNNLSATTGQGGMFEFLDLQDGGDYSITPSKNVNPLNGVTTFDLVLITRHILGITLLNTPYKLIAADVNRSGNITTFDLVELRKMVLFVNTEFPNNTSWRFVPKSYVFPNPANPWQQMFPEVININNISAAVMNANFVAIKTGDVNNSVDPNGNFGGSNEDRSGAELIFETDDLVFEAGKTYSINLRAKDFPQVSGFQCTLDFDKNALEFQSVTPTGFTSAENFGEKLLHEGALTASWNEALPVSIEDGETVIRLEFLAKTNGNLRDALKLNSRFTKAEAYAGNELEIRSVGLSFNPGSSQQTAYFELYQNVPNPFTNKTVIGFQLPAAGVATLTVFDASGKVLHVTEGNYSSGYNEISLNRRLLLADGVLFYRLESATHSSTKTMTLIGQ